MPDGVTTYGGPEVAMDEAVAMQQPVAQQGGPGVLGMVAFEYGRAAQFRIGQNVWSQRYGPLKTENLIARMFAPQATREEMLDWAGVNTKARFQMYRGPMTAMCEKAGFGKYGLYGSGVAPSQWLSTLGFYGKDPTREMASAIKFTNGKLGFGKMTAGEAMVDLLNYDIPGRGTGVVAKNIKRAMTTLGTNLSWEEAGHLMAGRAFTTVGPDGAAYFIRGAGKAGKEV